MNFVLIYLNYIELLIMEQNDKELLDYCNIEAIKNIAYYWDKILENIKNNFDNNYFNFIQIKNIDECFNIIYNDLLILPLELKQKFENKNIYCLYYDEENNLDFWILNKNIFRNYSEYKDKYFLNDNFFDIIKWFNLDKKIFWDIYIKEIDNTRFKICFSNWLDIYFTTWKEKQCYYNFWKVQILINTKKIIEKKDKIYSELVIKIILKKIQNNLLKI